MGAWLNPIETQFNTKLREHVKGETGEDELGTKGFCHGEYYRCRYGLQCTEMNESHI